MPPKKGMVVVLKVNQRLLSASNGGWNRFFGIELNGKPLQPVTNLNMPRLMIRGMVTRTSIKSEANVPNWLPGSMPLLFTMFAPADTEEPDIRVISNRAEGHNYYLLIDDVVNKQIIGADDRIESDTPNRIRFCNALPSRIVQTSLYVKDAVVGYVPANQVNDLVGLKMVEFKPIAAPAATIRGEKATLKISRTGGMELVNGGKSLFFEAFYSYAAKPEMKYSKFGIAEMKGENGINVKVNGNGTVVFQTKTLKINRTIKSCGHYFRVVDSITNISSKDRGLIWKQHVGYSGAMPDKCRLSGVSNLTSSTTRGANNATLFVSNGVSSVGIIAEDTITRNLIDMHLDSNLVSLGVTGLGLPAGKTLVADWTIYPMQAPEIGYYDFINQVRRDWGVNVTIPGPFHFGFSGKKGLNIQFGFLNPWHRYATGTKMTDAQYVAKVSKDAADLRKRYPGIKLLAKTEHNLVPMVVANLDWFDKSYLTKGDRKNPKTRYAQYLPPEASKKLVAATPFRDSMLWNANGGVMFDNFYAYKNHDTINLMVQVEENNQRYKMFIEQIQVCMDQAKLDGLYIDQWNPTARDGIDFSKWDGYSVVLDKTGEIKSRYYNFALTGAKGRMKIAKMITDKGGIVFTNGHPITREEQNSGRLSFAEMENDPCDPNTYWDTIPPESPSLAMAHLASPIVLCLRPSRYLNGRNPELKAKILTKGFIMAFRNGNIPYYYTSDIITEGPNAGSFEIANQILPFTPVKLGEGVMVGKERTIVCKSGTYTVSGKKAPRITKFNSNGYPTTEVIKATGKPGAWTAAIKLNDWNEIAVMIVQD